MTTVSTEAKDVFDSSSARKAVPLRKKNRLVWGMGGMLLVAVIGGGLLLGGGGADESAGGIVNTYTILPMDFQIALKEKGELKALDSVDVKCEVEGTSTILWIVEEGSMVKKGDLLVELASDQIEEKLQQSEILEATKHAAAEAGKSEFEIEKDQTDSDITAAALKLELAELALKQYIEGDWIQQKTEAHLAVLQAESEHKRAKERSEASARLYEKKFITKVELDADLFGFEKAGYELEKAKLGYQILEDYTHTMDLKKLEEDVREATRGLTRVKLQAKASLAKAEVKRDSAMAELDLTRQRLEKYREQKEKTKIKAPTPGLVVYHSERHYNQEGIKEGATVRQRQTIIRLPDTSVMTVEVRIHETKTNQIAVGQPVMITVDGLPDKRFSGKVTKIAALADSRDRWLNRDLKEYETQITVDQTDSDLKPGATAKAEILIDELHDVLAVPVQAVFSKGGRSYVFRKTGTKRTDPVEVTLGQASEEYVEITDGLASGQQVMLGISEEMKREVPEGEGTGTPRIDAVARRGKPASGKKAGKPAKAQTTMAKKQQKHPKEDGRRVDRTDKRRDKKSPSVQ